MAPSCFDSTTSKWAKIAKCSQDTAYRDVLDLMERGALKKGAAGEMAELLGTKKSNISQLESVHSE